MLQDLETLEAMPLFEATIETACPSPGRLIQLLPAVGHLLELRVLGQKDEVIFGGEPVDDLRISDTSQSQRNDVLALDPLGLKVSVESKWKVLV